MGAWFESILIRTENAGLVQLAARELAKESDCKFLVGPAVDGWTSIFPSEISDISSDFARRIPHDIFHLLVHDDDVFIYYFYRSGQLMDYYISRPEHCEEISEKEKKES